MASPSPSRNLSGSSQPSQLQAIIAAFRSIPTSVAIILGIILGLFVSQWITSAVSAFTSYHIVRHSARLVALH